MKEDKATDRLQQELTQLQQRVAELEQAEEALQKSEERYRALVENLSEVIYATDEAGVITYISPTIEPLLGYRTTEVIGHHLEGFIHQDDLARVKENFETVLSGRTATNEYRVLTKSGEIRWIRTSSQPTLEGPRVIGVHGILTDISERKQVEETLRRRADELAALQETLVDIVASHDLTILFQTIVERAVRLLNARGGGLYLCDPEKKEVRCEMSYNTPRDYRGTVLRYGEGAAGTVAKTGEPLIIDDYRSWNKRAGIFDEEQPFTAILSVPMVWQDQVTGVIHILDDVESRRFTEADLELLIAFANHAAIALENARLYEETRQLAAFNEGIVKSVLVGISVEDTDGNFTFLNPAAAELFGYTVDELIGQHWTAVVPPDQQAIVEQALKQRMQGEGSFYELEILRKDGTRRSILVSGSPRFEEGRYFGVQAVFTDITPQKQAEAAVRTQKDKFEGMVASLGDGLDVVSQDYRVHFQNKVLRDRFGNLTGKLCYEEYMGRETPCESCPMVKAIATGSTQRAELTGIDGREYELTSTPFQDIDGETKVIEVVRDITKRKQAEEEIRRLSQFQESIIDNANVWLDVLDENGNVLIWNKAAEKISGYSREEVVDHDKIWEWLYPDESYRKEINKEVSAIIKRGKVVEGFETTIRCKDGRTRTISWNSRNLLDDDGTPIGSIALGRDITKQKQAEKAIRELSHLQQSIIDHANVWLSVLDERGLVVTWNKTAEAISGYSQEEAVGNEMLWEWLYPDEAYRKGRIEKATAVIEGSVEKFDEDTTIRCKDGQDKIMSWNIQSLHADTGKVIGFLSIGLDITEQKQAEDRLAHMATHDSLTGLPNRQAFNDRLDLELAHAHRSQQKIAVMMLDLDRFKDVNDILGHSTGDQLLKAVGNRLTDLQRKSDTIARLGGDEFMLILPEISQTEDAEKIAQKLLETVRQPFVADGHELHITTSIGVAIYPEDAEDVETLVKNADIAMYRAKEDGRNIYRRYTPRDH